MSHAHAPTAHALVRDLSIYTPRGRLRVFRRDRRARPDSAYQCSCGFKIDDSFATSRRKARPLHGDHRAAVGARAASLQRGLAVFAEKASQL